MWFLSSTAAEINSSIDSIEILPEIQSVTAPEKVTSLLSTEEAAKAALDNVLPSYVPFTLTTNGAITITGNGTDEISAFKTSAGNGWSYHAYTQTGYTAPVTMEFFKRAASGDNGASYMMIGWNVDPTTNASYTSIDHAAYPYRQDRYNVHVNGSSTDYGPWDENKKFYLTYTADGRILHWNGDTLLYSANYNPDTVYLDSSFYSQNSTFGGVTSLRIIQAEWNGSEYVVP